MQRKSIQTVVWNRNGWRYELIQCQGRVAAPGRGGTVQGARVYSCLPRPPRADFTPRHRAAIEICRTIPLDGRLHASVVRL